jgi:hypothetical protein
MRRAVKPASVIEREKEKAEAATAESAPRERSSMATSTLGLRPLLTPPRSARGSSSRPENQTRGSGPSARPLASPTNRRTMNLKSPSARRSAHERLERMTTRESGARQGRTAARARSKPQPHRHPTMPSMPPTAATRSRLSSPIGTNEGIADGLGRQTRAESSAASRATANHHQKDALTMKNCEHCGGEFEPRKYPGGRVLLSWVRPPCPMRRCRQRAARCQR